MADDADQEDIAQALDAHEVRKRSTDLPLFYGRTDKDVISARLLASRVDKAAEIGNWNVARRCNEFYLILRDKALLWYDSLDSRGVATNDWDQLKAAFLQAYELKATARTTCANFTDLQQKGSETVNDFFNRVNAVVRRLGDLRPAALDAVRLNVPAAAAAISVQVKAEGTKDERKYWQQLLFTAGLKDDIRLKVMESNPADLAAAFATASEQETLLNERKKQSFQVNLISDKVQPDALADWEQSDIDLLEDAMLLKINNIRLTAGRRPFRRSNFRSGPPLQRQPNGPIYRSSNNMNGNVNSNITCHYCHKRGHVQRVCNSRRRDNAPMVAAPRQPAVQALSAQAPPPDTTATLHTIAALNW